MDLLDVGRIVLGLVLLVAGGELLVPGGGAALAVRSGLTPLVVGLTVVSVATSTPELAVSTGAALRGESDLALGDVVGSSIANVLLILGISALILPLTARRRIVRVDVPVMLGLGLLTLGLSLDGRLGVADGVLLLVLFLVHLVASVWIARGDTAEDEEPRPGEGNAAVASGRVAVLLVLAGVVLLVVGAGQLVSGVTSVATAQGVSGLVVGLTVVGSCIANLGSSWGCRPSSPGGWRCRRRSSPWTCR